MIPKTRMPKQMVGRIKFRFGDIIIIVAINRTRNHLQGYQKTHNVIPVSKEHLVSRRKRAGKTSFHNNPETEELRGTLLCNFQQDVFLETMVFT